MQQEKIDPARPANNADETRATTSLDDAVAADTGNIPPRWRNRRRILMLLGPVLILAGVAFAYVTGGRYVSTDNAYIKADMVMVAAETSGLIDHVNVHRNQHVAKGDVLFHIEDRPHRIALAEAEAHLATIRNEINSLKANYRQKQEELALARTDVEFFTSEYTRQSELLKTKAISGVKVDAIRHDLDVARQRIRVTEQELAQVAAQLSGNPDLPLESYPQYAFAEAARDRATLDLERTTIRAPLVGITGPAPEPGQQVIGNSPFSSPVMSIISDKGVWIDANFKETDLTHVQPGNPVIIHVDTYPGREWQGTVDSINQATGSEFSVIPAQNATGNWVKVVQRIPVRISLQANGDDPALRAGMSTTVEIDTGHHRVLPHFMQTALLWFGVTPTAQAGEVPK